MKHLANCPMPEFLKQANRLRAPFVEWINKTGIPEIRKRMPEGFDAMTDDEKKVAYRQQINDNMADIITAAVDKDPDGTMQVIGIATFTEPDQYAEHSFPEYMQAVMEMYRDDYVRDFFTYYLRSTLKPSTEA